MVDSLSEQEFNRHFEIVSNNANGNCLFESMERLLINTPYEKENGKLHASKIRSMVSEFYTNFDRDINYPVNTIEHDIKMGIMFDNSDFDEANNVISHEYNVRNDKVWASMTDVLICSLLFEVNIYIYTKNMLYLKYDMSKYDISKIKPQYNYKTTLHILYNGTNHFEAILIKKRSRKV
jgi:hypothetical protein